MSEVVADHRIPDEEKLEFEADVPQLMSVLIDGVYSAKELFLRELVSNASDALSKFISQKNSLDTAGYTTESLSNLKIQIVLNKAKKTISIIDNGIGMTRSDLKTYLGSIASSGTKKFREALDQSGGDLSSANVDGLIGQFGLGFYSSFLVASRVDVLSKSSKDEGYLWSSDGSSHYTLRPHEVDFLHGTVVVLHLKEGEDDVYLSSDKIIELVKKHSFLIPRPIHLIYEEEAKEEPKAEKAEEQDEDVKEIKGEDDEEAEKPEVAAEAAAEAATEEVSKKTRVVEKRINFEVPVWTKKVEDIPEEDLKKFYKTLSNDYDDYLAVQSWHFEGTVNLRILLFIPKHARMDFFEKPLEKAKNIKIYNSNVFVTDSLTLDVVPEWMSFVVGAVSSSDFPMNISREFPQGTTVMTLLKKKLPKCIAEMIGRLERDSQKFDKFYKEFSTSVKLAVRQTDGPTQEQFARFLRYPTNLDAKALSLDEYVEQLPAESKQILILTGLNAKDVKESVYLDAYKDKHVLLMSDAIDEIMLQGFKSYRDHPFQMISSEGISGAVASDAEEFARLKEYIQAQLKDKVERVELSSRLGTVPATLITTKYSNSSTMENIIKSHPGAANNPIYAMMMPSSKKIFEVYTEHPVIRELNGLLAGGETEQTAKYVKFLYESTLMAGGFTLDDKRSFIDDLNRVFTEAIGNSKRE